jgi:peroxiredoxin Q/BCP
VSNRVDSRKRGSMKHLLILTTLCFSLSAYSKELKTGDAAPKVSGMTADGSTLDLGDLYKKGKVLVFFYPKAHTSGCTAQACSLRDGYEKLKKFNVNVVGVSMDKVEDQKSFKEENHLPYPLIADPDHKVIDAFGVPINSGHANREAYLIVDGKIAWMDHHASTEKQADDVIKVLSKTKQN